MREPVQQRGRVSTDPVLLRELVREVVADLIAAELHPEGPCQH